jgi:UDP-N-acetylmuramoyl-tripeptide--D-alanyl-D-alanine ligase
MEPIPPTLGEENDGAPLGGTEFTLNGRFRYRLNVPGRHNVSNALAAIAVARRFNMDHKEIAERLAEFRSPPMRLQVHRFDKLTLINDAYNANPASLAAAVEVLTNLPAPKRRVLVLGDMRELGNSAERLHREAAERIGISGVDLVITVGEHAKLMAEIIARTSGDLIETRSYASTASVKHRLCTYLRKDDTVMLKGSRLLQLEELVNVIRDWVERKSSGRKPGGRVKSMGGKRGKIASTRTKTAAGKG